MHWSEKIAKEIIRKYPDNKEYVCAAGISPSGSVHIGNFRDIAHPINAEMRQVVEDAVLKAYHEAVAQLEVAAE